jgi:hypothetical protein
MQVEIHFSEMGMASRTQFEKKFVSEKVTTVNARFSNPSLEFSRQHDHAGMRRKSINPKTLNALYVSVCLCYLRHLKSNSVTAYTNR